MQVLISENIFDKSSWEEWSDVEDIREFIIQRYPEGFPESMRIYDKFCSKDRDITPTSDKEFENLINYTGPIHLIQYPQDPTGGVLTAILLGAAVLGGAFFLIKDLIPQNPSGNISRSPNNEFSRRTNSPRINSRIPDILGRVRSTPDLINAVYSKFENNVELEISYMCVGVGEYLIEDVREDVTPMSNISGSSYEFYGPGTSPNSGIPFLTGGDPIIEPLVSARRISSVNGQVLRAPNSDSYKGKLNVIFTYPNEIHISDDEKDISESFEVGDSITIVNSQFTRIASEASLNIFQSIFNLDGSIDVDSDPTSIFEVGDTIVINNALFAFDPEVDVTSSTSSLSGTGTASSSATTSVSASTSTTVNRTLTGKVTVGGVDYSVDFTGTTITADSTTTVSASTSVTTSITDITTPGVPSGFAANANGTNVVDLSGTYVISGLTSSSITLEDPELINPDWNFLNLFEDDQSPERIVRIDIDEKIVSGDLDGTYEITSVFDNVIILDNPASENASWNDLDLLQDNSTQPLSPTITSIYDKWVGTFTTVECEKIYANFVALGGLFKDDGTQYGLSVSVTMECTPVNSSGTPTGSAETFTGTLQGSSVTKSLAAVTIEAELSIRSRWSVRFKRTTETDKQFEGSIQDEVKVRDMYAVDSITDNDFGNVTTVYTKSYATAGALTLKERKLNCLATRKIPTRISGTTFTTNQPTRRIDDILVFAATSPNIGNRQLSELNIEEIYDTVQEIEDYFGTEEAVSFGHTFDDINMSFEDTMGIIARSCFSVVYRIGSQIGLRFEKETNNSVALFNHRNKIPGSEKRTVRFKPQDNHDGVEVEYFDSNDGSSKIYYVPEDQSAVNPMKTTLLGVQSNVIAHFHAWRLFNKIKYQNTFVEFTTLEEGALIISSDRVLVSDGTRPDTQDGEVKYQDGLLLGLSQPVKIEPEKDYFIFLWLPDGTVESIQIDAENGSQEVTLTSPTSISLSLNEDNSIKTLYEIVASDYTREKSFLVLDKDPSSENEYDLKLVNYSDKFYEHDKDYIDEIITDD